MWRLLYRPVQQAPLAFCDRQSVEAKELVPVERPSTNRIGYVSFLNYQPRQEWYWVSEQKAEQMSVFLSWDSDADDALDCKINPICSC